MRYALRQLINSPGFTVVALITLALGIGVNTTIFSLINVLVYQMPEFKEPERLVSIYGATPENPHGGLGLGNVRDLMEQNTVFQEVATYNYYTPNLSLPGSPPDRVPGFGVSGDFFKILGVNPLMGRFFNSNETGPGHTDAVVSEKFWKNRLGGKADVIGSTIRLDGKVVTVIGVMPASFKDLAWSDAEIWQPNQWSSSDWANREGYFWMRIITRLKPGVGLEQAQVQMDTVAKRLAHDYPVTNAHTGIHLERLEDYRTRGGTQQLWIFQGLTLCVLLIACVNLASLQLSRTAGRTHEFAVRIALGASRSQLIRQLLAESVLLSLAGGALGLMVSYWGNSILGKAISLEMGIDYRVVGFTLLASVVTGIAFGLTPAWGASRSDVNLVLKQGSKSATADRSKQRLRNILVIGELALALGLLGAAGFFIRGTEKLVRPPSDLGWQYENLLTGSFMLPYTTYTNDEQTRNGIERISQSLAALPGVDHVAITASIPIYSLSGAEPFQIEGQPPPPKDRIVNYPTESVTADFFSTLGIKLRAGRGFTSSDQANSQKVIVINARMAQKLWPHGDAIGHRLGSADPAHPNWQEIVGIVNDIRFPGVPDAFQPVFQTYHPVTQDLNQHWLNFAIHCKIPPETMIDSVRRAVAKADSDLAISDVRTVTATIKENQKAIYTIEGILIFAAILGLLFSLIGTYAVVANLVVQRTKEIGIRIALGASSRTVFALLLKNGVRLAGYGTGIGMLLAFAATNLLSKGMPFMEGEDPLLTLGFAGLLILATLLASCLPARRATLVNPVEALRAE